jgi:hypothetical protein
MTNGRCHFVFFFFFFFPALFWLSFLHWRGLHLGVEDSVHCQPCVFFLRHCVLIGLCGICFLPPCRGIYVYFFFNVVYYFS